MYNFCFHPTKIALLKVLNDPFTKSKLKPCLHLTWLSRSLWFEDTTALRTYFCCLKLPVSFSSNLSSTWPPLCEFLGSVLGSVLFPEFVKWTISGRLYLALPAIKWISGQKHGNAMSWSEGHHTRYLRCNEGELVKGSCCLKNRKALFLVSSWGVSVSDTPCECECDRACDSPGLSS